MSPLYLFDLIGTFAFAAYGAYLAQQKGFDIFGVFVCAFVSAFAGGSIRALLLNQLPIYFIDSFYLFTVGLGLLFSIILFHRFAMIQRFMLSLDAIGLVTFAFLGGTIALQNHLGLIGVLILSTISAVGGGVCCDLLMREVPRIFYRDFYATPAILVGFGVFFLRTFLENTLVSYGLLFAVFCIRLFAIKFQVELWKPVRLGPERSSQN